LKIYDAGRRPGNWSSWFFWLVKEANSERTLIQRRRSGSGFILDEQYCGRNWEIQPQGLLEILCISQSSAVEVKSMLYVLSDLEYLTEDKIVEMRAKADETRNITPAFIKYLRNTLKKTD
jgi:hypothetical protein